MNQPRDIAIGHFTRTDQTQIAAGMGEGDIVIFARDDAMMEAVFDGATIYYRLNAPYAKDTVKGELVQSDGVYSGTANVLTSCGWKTLNVTARAQ